MSNPTERNLAYGFGLIGGVLIWVAALIAAVVAVARYSSNSGGPYPAGPISAAVILFVLGGLVLFFAYLGQRAWRDRPIVTGVVLVVLAAVTWGILGFGADAVALIGAIFVLVAGVLYLIEPATHLVRTTATS